MHPLTRFELFFPPEEVRFDKHPLPDEELVSGDTDGARQEASLAPEMDGGSRDTEPFSNLRRGNVRLVEILLGNVFRMFHLHSLVKPAPQHTGQG